MASPANVGFALFDGTGAPLTGQTPTFTTYKTEAGVNVTPPVITEVGGGLYTFTPTFTAGHCVAYMLDGGVSASPRYQYGFLRPEDMVVTEDAVWNAARTAHVTAATFGEWAKIAWSVAQGRIEVDPTAGTIKFFDDDNTTVVVQRKLRLGDDVTLAGLDALIRRGPGQ